MAGGARVAVVVADRVFRCALLLFAVLSSGACGRIGGDRPLVVGFDDHPATLDPHIHNHGVTWSVLSNFYDSLVRFSPEMQLEPALAVAL